MQLGLAMASSLSRGMYSVQWAVCSDAQTLGSPLEVKGYRLWIKRGAEGMWDKEGSLYKVSDMINVDEKEQSMARPTTHL